MDAADAEEYLARAVAAYAEAEANLERVRADLYEAIRAVAPVLRQTEIVQRTGWTREYIRRITRGLV